MLHGVGDTKILKIGVVKRECSWAKAKKKRAEKKRAEKKRAEKRRKSGEGVP